MTRFLFCKEGTAVWISHLDLQRMFQRAFNRAKIQIAVTNGFNPHAYVAMALPLSVGMESQCEILDCRLADESISPEEAAERLNRAGFPEGITILKGYSSDRKLREIGSLRARLMMEYDNGVPEGAEERIRELFLREEITASKHSKKKGQIEINIRPMILDVQVAQKNTCQIEMTATVQAGEPSLNPELLVQAVTRYLPEDRPDAVKIRRLEVFDQEGNAFR